MAFHASESNFTRRAHEFNPYYVLGDYTLKGTTTSYRANESIYICTLHHIKIRSDAPLAQYHTACMAWGNMCLWGFRRDWTIHSIHQNHDDVIERKHFPRYWPFVRGIHRSQVNSPHKGQWRGALMFSLICARINGWVNNREAGDLRRRCAHHDVSVMINAYGHVVFLFGRHCIIGSWWICVTYLSLLSRDSIF